MLSIFIFRFYNNIMCVCVRVGVLYGEIKIEIVLNILFNDI